MRIEYSTAKRCHADVTHARYLLQLRALSGTAISTDSRLANHAAAAPSSMHRKYRSIPGSKHKGGQYTVPSPSTYGSARAAGPSAERAAATALGAAAVDDGDEDSDQRAAQMVRLQLAELPRSFPVLLPVLEEHQGDRVAVPREGQWYEESPSDRQQPREADVRRRGRRLSGGLRDASLLCGAGTTSARTPTPTASYQR